jgi:hypothetical protein
MLEIKHNPQGRVNAAHIFEAKVTHAASEPIGIDRRGLFSRHTRDAAVDLNFRAKACGPG